MIKVRGNLVEMCIRAIIWPFVQINGTGGQMQMSAKNRITVKEVAAAVGIAN